MARIFHIDPITVLDCPPDVYEIRMACAEVAIEQMNREREG